MKADSLAAPGSCQRTQGVMEGEDEIQKKEVMFGPLSFPDSSSLQLRDYFGFFKEYSVPCMLCPACFKLPDEKSFFLVHLLDEHKLIIADVDKVAGLKGYCDYWRRRLALQPLSNFCSTITCKDESGETKDEFFLLSDAVKEDKLIREGLQKKRLEWVLDIQARERSTPIHRSCLFCRESFVSLRSEYFNHLYSVHNFHFGSPDNLVFTDELLDILENMMERNRCIFCDGYFHNRSILKEHMRKKQHKRVNPENKKFDKFFIINYLEMGRSWQQIQNEEDDTDYSDSDEEWSDWSEEIVEPSIYCLFCDETNRKFDDILDHMSQKHAFDFLESCENNSLDFYLRVKLVNFLRLCVHNLQCPSCFSAFSEKVELLSHMTEEEHFKVPERSFWDQPEFYFSTYENDSFLCHLDDHSEDENAEEVVNPVEEIDDAKDVEDKPTQEVHNNVLAEEKHAEHEENVDSIQDADNND